MRGILVSLGSIAAMALLVVLVPPLREAVVLAVQGDTDQLRDDLRGDGLGGVLVLFVLTQVHAVVFYPTEIVTAAGGFVYGFAVGFPLLLAFWTISGIASWFLGRWLGRPLFVKLFSEERIAKAERAIDRGGVGVLIAARLVPVVPYSLFSYVAGGARVPLWRFTWTSAVGYAPLTAGVVLLGDRLEELSLTDPVIYLVLVPVLALVLGAKPLARKLRLEDDGDPDPKGPAPDLTPAPE